MCCQVYVTPLDKVVAVAILHTGLFDDTSNISKYEGYPYGREIPEEGSRVLAKFDGNRLLLNLRPGVHTMADHARSKLAASVAFEIAWRYAEKLGSVAQIYQAANIQGCKAEHGDIALIAQPGLRPFKWEDICLGFREAILAQT